MPPAVPSTIFPTEERFVNVVREATPGTIPAAPYGTTFPLINLEPEDKPIWLLDETLRASMGDFYGMYQGPEYAQVTIPESPVFADMICHPLYNTLGDYTQSAPAAAPSTTLTGTNNVGATTLNVTLGTGFTVNMWILVYQAGATGPAELVQVSSSTAGTIVLQAATPLRFSHTAGATVTNTTVAAGTYQHIFSVLNSGFVAPGNYQNFAQPPTHTWTDRTQVPLLGGNPGGARQYADACFGSLTLTGHAEKLLDWNGSFSSWVGQIAASAPVASVSSATPYPDFNAVTNLATAGALAQIFDINEWQITLTRQLKVTFTNDGTQNPYVIGRGKVAVAGKLVFAPAVDETALLYMLGNTQPQLQIVASNGLATSSPLYEAVQVDIILAAFDTSKLVSSDVLFGYDVAFKAPHVITTRNTITTTGWSGGFSAIKITVSNAVPIF